MNLYSLGIHYKSEVIGEIEDLKIKSALGDFLSPEICQATISRKYSIVNVCTCFIMYQLQSSLIINGT